MSIRHIFFSSSPSYYIYIFLLYTSRRWERTSVQSLSFLCNGLSLKVSSWTHTYFAEYFLYAMDLTCRDKKCLFRKYVWMRINLENWHGNRNTLECSSFKILLFIHLSIYLFIFCTIRQVHLTCLDSILVYKLSKTAINKFI